MQSAPALTDWPLLGVTRKMPAASPSAPAFGNNSQTQPQWLAVRQMGSKRPFTDSGTAPPSKRPSSSAGMREPTLQSEAIRADLSSNFESLAEQIAALNDERFEPDGVPMRYETMRTGGYGKEHAGFIVFTNQGPPFVNAGRPNNDVESGDKLHVSVSRSHVERAFDSLAGLLFAADSPINQWKVTDIYRAPPKHRITEGAQLTLFVNPRGCSRYCAQHLHKVRAFIGRIEAILSQQGIDPGVRPESDVAAPHWRYVSYRNEFASGRTGGEAQRIGLEQEPFFKLIGGTGP